MVVGEVCCLVLLMVFCPSFRAHLVSPRDAPHHGPCRCGGIPDLWELAAYRHHELCLCHLDTSGAGSYLRGRLACL